MLLLVPGKNNQDQTISGMLPSATTVEGKDTLPGATTRIANKGRSPWQLQERKSVVHSTPFKLSIDDWVQSQLTSRKWTMLQQCHIYNTVHQQTHFRTHTWMEWNECARKDTWERANTSKSKSSPSGVRTVLALLKLTRNTHCSGNLWLDWVCPIACS